MYKQKAKKVHEPYYVTPSVSQSLTEVTFKEGLTIHNPFSDDKFDGEKPDFDTFIHRVFCAYDPAMNEYQIKDLINR